MTDHAKDEMVSDGLTEEDVEAALLSGRIIRMQKDHLDRRKYTVEGRGIAGRPVRTVCRYSDSGERLVVITVSEVGED